ncbi:thioredoxin-like protein [Trichoderma barbatum]
MMANFTIKIISDNICPFCFLGKARLDRAISTFRNATPKGETDNFTISWHAFYLEPHASFESVPVRQHVAQKFGSLGRVDALHERLAQAGIEEGLNFSFKGLIGNTRDSHRLVQLGRLKGNEIENKVVHEIMKIFFEEGGDITSIKDLVKAAERGGLDANEAREWLLSENGQNEVEEEVNEAIKLGVTAVPTFIINDKYRVEGAQSVAEFIKQFARAKAGEQAKENLT